MTTQETRTWKRKRSYHIFTVDVIRHKTRPKKVNSLFLDSKYPMTHVVIHTLRRHVRGSKQVGKLWNPNKTRILITSRPTVGPSESKGDATERLSSYPRRCTTRVTRVSRPMFSWTHDSEEERTNAHTNECRLNNDIYPVSLSEPVGGLNTEVKNFRAHSFSVTFNTL